MMPAYAQLPNAKSQEVNLDKVLTALSVVETDIGRFRRNVTMRDVIRLLADEIERRIEEKKKCNQS